MKRLALAIVALSALSAPALAANCAKDYKDFWEKFDREKFAKISAEQVRRIAERKLPDLNTYKLESAIEIIKGLDRKLPIIITADENNPEQESRIRQQGIFYYHVNSFGPDDLILAISNAMVRSSQ